jgi:hypothetical protein
MGLIQQARLVNTQPFVPECKKKSGLLDRIQNCSAYDLLLSEFRGFLALTGYDRAGILYPSVDGDPVFLMNTGMDLTTAHRFSVSIPSLCKNPDDTGWNVFSSTSLELFTSCFSSHELDSLLSVCTQPVCFPDGTNAVIILVESKLDSVRVKKNLISCKAETLNLVNAIIKHRQVFTYLSRIAQANLTFDAVQDRIKSSITSGKKANLVHISLVRIFESAEMIATDSDKLELFTAFVHQITRQVGSVNIVRKTASFSLNIALFSSVPLDIDMYLFQILKPLEAIFGVHRISGIAVNTAGIASDPGEIIDFLFREN